MTKPNSIEIVFVIDRSGSMTSIANDMIGGFDAFIAKQKETPGECRVTLTQFDDTYDVVYTSRPLNEVRSLDLVPRGTTALLDAIGRTIVDTGNRLQKMREEERPSQVLFVIITDGHENSSREFNRARVFDMITHQRDKYSWEFIFLGANQDSLATAHDIGVSTTNAVTYAATKGGTRGLMRGLSANVSTYRSSGLGKMDHLYDQASYDAAIEQEPDVLPALKDMATTIHRNVIVPFAPNPKPDDGE